MPVPPVRTISHHCDREPASFASRLLRLPTPGRRTCRQASRARWARSLLLALASLALLAAPALADVHYSRSTGSTSGTCGTWATACTLTYALTQAAAGDEVWVAQGIYRPATTGNRSASFALNRNITLYGGFPPSGSPTLTDRNPTLYPTVLSGDQLGNDPTDANGVVLDWSSIDDTNGADNSYSVIDMSASPTLDGFTVTSGHGDSSHPGAAIINWTSGASPTLRNMVFRGNHTDGPGGAIYLYNGTGATLDHVDFISNAALQGGALQIMVATVTASDVLFKDNYAGLGSGAAHIGGAVNGQGGSSESDTTHPQTYNRVRFEGNTAAGSGGLDMLFGVLTLNDVSFVGNVSAASNGIGGLGPSLATTTVTNAVFSGNQGAGIYNNGGTMTLTNVTSSGNSGFGLASAGTVSARNSIFFGNGWESFYRFSGTASLSYSLVQGGCLGGATCTSVISGDPAFVSPITVAAPTLTGDLRLLPSSPAIDAGDNTVASPTLPSTDLDGNARRLDSPDVPDTGNGTAPIVDMGAYEFLGPAPELTAVKTNDAGAGATPGTPFTWTITVANTGSLAAAFASGDVVLRDDLPSAGVTYGTPTVTPTNVSGTVACSIDGAATLLCTASGAVSLGATTGRLVVAVAVTPSAVGTLANPRPSGTCAVDPGNVVDESNETNDACGNTVSVASLTPVLTTAAHDAAHNVITTAPVGAPIHGWASVTGSGPMPTGTLTLDLYDNASCTGTPVGTDSKTLLADGTAESDTFTMVDPGFYYRVTYGGDGVYTPVTGACTLFPATQPGPTFVVNTSLDDAGDGICTGLHCTLREAVAAANAQPGANAVTFAIGDGVMIVLGAQLEVTDTSGALTIDGETHGISVSGNGAARVFLVTASSSLTLHGLTVSNGFCGSACSGGGLSNDGGAVNLSDCAFSSNHASLSGGAVSNGSGGILTVSGSSFAQNSATSGGGICVMDGAMSVTGSTFDRNEAGDDGGAIYALDAESLVVNSSTFSGNHAIDAGGGMMVPGDHLTITSSTFVGNTAGSSGGTLVVSSGTATVNNTIVGDASTTGCLLSFSGGNNLTDGPSCPGTRVSWLGLGPLGSYGGVTQTIPLLPGSPAIDAGNCAAAPATDQRGVARPQPEGGACDSGAFESRGFSLGNLSGTSQSAVVTTVFALPLGLTVTANDAGEPVEGGVVTFTAPTTGASIAAPTPFTVSIGGGGAVSAAVAANGTAGGPYAVTASTTGATSASFALTNVAWPDTSVTSSPGNPSGSGSASFGFGGSGGVPPLAFQCSLDGSAFAPCTSPQPYTGLADGSHTFQVRALDAVGNTDPTPASYAWLIDTISPDTTITAHPPATTSSTSASFTFTGSDGSGTGVASFECRLDGGAFAPCTSPQTYSGLADGSHTFQVRALDAAGNADATPASTTWVVDTTAPDTTITATPPAVQHDPVASFLFSGNDGSGSGVESFECRLDGGAFAPCTNGHTYSGLADGSHTFQVRAVDAVGNTDPTPASFTWVVDTTAPDTTITAQPPATTSSTSASFAFTGSDPGGAGVASFECRLDGGAFATCTSPQSYTGLADGSHTFQVRALDAAGNADATPATATWVVDTTAPDTTITANPPATTSSTSASFAFTGSDPGGTGVTGFECRLDGGAFAACTSPQPYTGLTDGSHTFQVRALDAAGNTDPTPASYTWVVDTTAPDTTITAHPPATTSSTSASFTFTGSDGSGTGVTSFECRLDAAAFAPCTSPQPYAGLADGSHTFQVRALDAVGTTDPTPASTTWVVDTTAPDTTLTATPPPAQHGPIASFSFTGNDGSGSGVASFECRLDSAAFAACTSPQEYPGLIDGSHTFEVRALDLAGNADPTPASYTWLVEAQADLTLQALATPAVAAPGASFSHTYTVGNLGPSPATGVTLAITLPSGATLDTVTPAACVPGSGTVTCTIGALAASGSFTATLTFTAATSGVHTSAGVVSGTEPDPASGNNAAAATTNLGRILATPSPVNMRVPIYSQGQRTLTLTNDSPLAVGYTLVERPNEYVWARPAITGRTWQVEPIHATDRTALAVPEHPLPDRPVEPLAPVQVLDFGTGLSWPWGIGLDTLTSRLFIGDEDNINYGFTLAGIATGETIDTTSWCPLPQWGADMTYDPYSQKLWQLNIGSDNCIHEMDAVTLTSTGASICPAWGTFYQGLAFDPVTDTFFAGSWNDGQIRRFNRAGTILETVAAGLATSGLAYNPSTGHLFVLTNSAGPADLYVLDVTTGYHLVASFKLAGMGAYEQAGLEADCAGNLYAVNQSTSQVLVVASGEGGFCSFMDVPWLAETPATGTIPAGGTQPVELSFITALQWPGLHRASLQVGGTAPFPGVDIPVTYTIAFLDVPETHWADRFIHALAGVRVTVGCGGGYFCPEQGVDRAMMAILLVRAMHGPYFSPQAATGVFVDVPINDTDRVADYVEQLYRDGVVAGCAMDAEGNRYYCPDTMVSRAQMAVFVAAGSGIAPVVPPTGYFTDVHGTVYAWAEGFIEAIFNAGITAGCDNHAFCPGDTITRAQLSVWLVAAFGFPYLPPST